MKKNGIIIAFFLVLGFPLVGLIIDKNVKLNGYIDDIPVIDANWKNVGDGTYQDFLGRKWENSFPGRKIMLKTRNQILYSFFNVSPNENVIIGKDKSLFEPLYILNDLQVNGPEEEDFFEQLGDKLQRIDMCLRENDKELYIFISPSKAEFEADKIPNKYLFLSNEDYYTYTNYQMLIKTLDEYNIRYFDSVGYIKQDTSQGLYGSPVFTNTGIHWTNAYGRESASKLVNYINSNSKYDLGELTVVEFDSDRPANPDTDLYDSLNLLFPPKGEWHSTILRVDRESEKPNVFIRGGSFTFQSLNAINESGVFDQFVHISNNKCFVNSYSNSISMSTYDSYDEIELDEMIGNSDIVILEVNEAIIPNMSFGLIDYLIQYPEYLDSNY